MTFGKAEICGAIRLSEKLYITTSIRKMVKKPSTKYSNQDDVYNAQKLPNEPDYSIGFKYVFK
jgi:hypothetical protein